MTARMRVVGVAIVLAGGCQTSLDVGTQKGKPADAAANAVKDAGADVARDVPADTGQADRPLDVAPRDTSPPDLIALASSYFPLARGFSWTYRVTPAIGAPFTKVQTVQGMDRVGGESLDRNKIVFVLETKKRSGREEPASDQTLTWQMWEGDSLVRYREQSFTKGTTIANLDEFWRPPRLRLDVAPDRMKAGATWVEPFFETSQAPGFPASAPVMRTRTWTMISIDETITVPRGMFRCVHVRVTSGARSKDYWFARGVGKVKETGSQTEELTDFNTQTATPSK